MWRAVILAALTLLPLSGQAQAADPRLPSKASGNHEALCAEEWTKRGHLDRRMYGYCLERQSEAYANLAAEVARYKDLPWLQAVIDDAIKKWTKRGARQDTMVAHTVHQQIDAYLDLAYLKQQKELNEKELQPCLRQWSRASPDWVMVRYCYKRATE